MEQYIEMIDLISMLASYNQIKGYEAQMTKEMIDSISMLFKFMYGCIKK